MNRARQLRLDAGMSVADVAENAGVAKGTVQRVECGENVQASKLAAVAAVFAVPASSLLGPAHSTEAAA